MEHEVFEVLLIKWIFEKAFWVIFQEVIRDPLVSLFRQVVEKL